jgi:hypothetical protein
MEAATMVRLLCPDHHDLILILLSFILSNRIFFFEQVLKRSKLNREGSRVHNTGFSGRYNLILMYMLNAVTPKQLYWECICTHTASEDAHL